MPLMKVAAYCPRDRWFLSWLSFNLLDWKKKKKKKLSGFFSVIPLSVFTVCASLTPHPSYSEGRGADAWNRRFSWSCLELFSSRRVVARLFFFLSFFLAHFPNWGKKKTKKLEKLQDHICCKLLHETIIMVMRDVKPLMRLQQRLIM